MTTRWQQEKQAVLLVGPDVVFAKGWSAVFLPNKHATLFLFFGVERRLFRAVNKIPAFHWVRFVAGLGAGFGMALLTSYTHAQGYGCHSNLSYINWVWRQGFSSLSLPKLHQTCVFWRTHTLSFYIPVCHHSPPQNVILVCSTQTSVFKFKLLLLLSFKSCFCWRWAVFPGVMNTSLSLSSRSLLCA